IPRFALNFRDIEDSVRAFSGEDNLSVEVWVKEFEDMATIMFSNELQKLIFAKRSLQGLAKMFANSERELTSWVKLKKALLAEFKTATN
ncbi:hypothetical protein KR084_003918, partial [Drosophila pseudotakahashii]